MSKYVSEWILYASSMHDIFHFLILTKSFDYYVKILLISYWITRESKELKVD